MIKRQVKQFNRLWQMPNSCLTRTNKVQTLQKYTHILHFITCLFKDFVECCNKLPTEKAPNVLYFLNEVFLPASYIFDLKTEVFQCCTITGKT